MEEEKISQDFRQKSIDETRNYLIEKINRTDWWVKNSKSFAQL